MWSPGIGWNKTRSEITKEGKMMKCCMTHRMIQFIHSDNEVG